jgi:hypothetical protein
VKSPRVFVVGTPEKKPSKLSSLLGLQRRISQGAHAFDVGTCPVLNHCLSCVPIRSVYLRCTGWSDVSHYLLVKEKNRYVFSACDTPSGSIFPISIPVSTDAHQYSVGKALRVTGTLYCHNTVNPICSHLSANVLLSQAARRSDYCKSAGADGATYVLFACRSSATTPFGVIPSIRFAAPCRGCH